MRQRINTHCDPISDSGWIHIFQRLISSSIQSGRIKTTAGSFHLPCAAGLGSSRF